MGVFTAFGGVQITNIPSDAVLTEYGEYDILTFTNSGTFTVTSPGTLEVLVVAGGGAGLGGGGGGGGVIHKTTFQVEAGEQTVTVGAGGSKTANYFSATGGVSSVFGLVAIGGGTGGSVNVGGRPGGSGGGGGYANATATAINKTQDGGAGTDGQGYAGGTGATIGSANSYGRAGGGGGAGGAGNGYGVTQNEDSSYSYTGTSADGGIGYLCSITGEARYYGGGGGGGMDVFATVAAGKGGLGGGGNGGKDSIAPTDGEAYTGGGGGGAGKNKNTNTAGGSGGSGIVILRYRNAERADTASGNVTAYGGTAFWDEENKCISRAFTSDGQISFAEDTTVDVLVVAGGGSGSNGSRGGGGGAGGFIEKTSYEVKAGVYSVVVGEGGDPDVTTAADKNGSNSSIFDLVAVGGGAGGAANANGVAGGSGGGAGARNNSNTSSGGEPTAGQGNAGGIGVNSGGAGGGGGAGSAGCAGTSNSSGYGGTGVCSRISGRLAWYAGGGNGTINRGIDLKSNIVIPGGGGRGHLTTAEAGEPFTGGGGGGAGQYMSQGWNAGNAGKGGSGQVIVRYASSELGYSDINKKEATGGTLTRYSKDGHRYRVHTFTENGEFTMPTWGKVSLLVVGGGGGGGANAGGGGGAGGVLVVTNLVLSPGTYPVTIGAGGAGGGTSTTSGLYVNGTTCGDIGGASIFANYYVPGGGGGGGCNVYGFVGASGGGGGSSNNASSIPVAGAGREEWGGFSGSKGAYGSPYRIGGCGGGAGGTIASDASAFEASGGIGIACDFSGALRYYGGGGGGGRGSNTALAGGEGGGGAGGVGANVGLDGKAGTGGGGGGGGHSGNTSYNGGNGGSGIVIVRYEVKPVGFLLFVR